MSRTLHRFSQKPGASRVFIFCLGLWLQLGWALPSHAQTEYWDEPYDGYPTLQSAVDHVAAPFYAQLGKDNPQGLDCIHNTCTVTIRYLDPSTNGGTAAVIDNSYNTTVGHTGILATSRSYSMIKNLGGCDRCTGHKGRAAGGSSPRGGAGEDAAGSGSADGSAAFETDPINTATGNKFQQDTDYRGSSWLTFRRFYNSQSGVAPANLGPQWRHTFDASLEILATGSSRPAFINLNRPDGARESFKPKNGAWVADADILDTLTEQDDASGNPTGYTVTVPSLRQTEIYDASGLLRSVTDPTGQGVVLAYSTTATPATVAPRPNLLLSVTDSWGRQLGFTYTAAGNLHQLTLPDAGTLTYGYDATTGNLIAVTYPDGKSRQYVYNESSLNGGGPLPNALTGVIDEAGVRYETTGYSYYSNGAAVSSSFAGGADAASISYTYKTVQATLTTPLGASISLGFKNVLGVLKAGSTGQPCGTQCNESLQSSTYDANGYPASTTDFKNVVSKTTYDANGLLDQQIDASGTASQRTTSTTWNIPLRVPLARTVLDNSGHTVAQTAWIYNAAGQATAQCQIDPTVAAAASYTCATTGTPPAGVRRWVYTYCTAVDTTQCPLAGLLLTTTDPLGHVTTYAYYLTDSATARHGDLQSVTDALGHVTTYASYDGAGRVTRSIDPNGVVTDLSYTPRGWLASRTVRALASGAASAGDATTTVGYTPYGAVASVTDPDGIATTYGYDAAHRLTRVTDAQGNYVQYTLDASGNRTREQTYTAAGIATRTLGRTFNKLGQLTAVTDGLGKTVFNAGTSGNYDANGNLVQSADALGVQRQQGYDALNRRVSTIDNASGTDAATKNTTSSIAYDALDRLTGVTDPGSLVTTYTYDGLGNGTALQSPDTGTSTDTFDAAGNALTHTDAKGVTSTSTYDALNRLTGTSYADTTLNVGYRYDEANSITGCAASSPVGRLTRVIETAVTTTYCYDSRGNVIQKQQQLGSTLDTTGYVYTLADRLQTVVSPSGTTTTYSRDADGRISSLSVSPPMGSAVTAVSAITYQPFGPIASYTLGNSQVITRTYDANYRATDVSSPALNLHFALDAMGNITAEGTAAGANPATETYSYDPLYRLKNIADGSTAIEGFTYNPTGDRLTKTGSGLGVGAYVYTTGTHRLSSIGTAARAMDANGNTTASTSAGQTWGYGYNGRNRLTVVQAGSVTVGTYTYNTMGQRIQKVVTSPTLLIQRYAYDEQNHLIGEYTSNSNRDTIWMEDVPVATVDTAGTTSTLNYVVADHLGTPRAVTNSSGTTIWSWAYASNPFGEQQPISLTGYVFNLRFPGQYADQESGLVNNGFRTHCLECGRYLQSDPLGLFGGQWSTYVYASNDPLRYIDPLGEKDYSDECTGRYKICADAQNKSSSTVKNWVMFKGCKASIDWGIKNGELAGTATACNAEFQQCSGEPYGYPIDGDPKIAQCYRKATTCLEKNGEK